MAGRSIDLKKTVPFLKMGDSNSFAFGSWGLNELLEEIENDKELERYKGDIIEPCSDTPCCFTPGPNRSFFLKYIPYLENVKQNPYPSYEIKVVSAYKPFLDNCFGSSLLTKHFNIGILMLADGIFAGAVYKNGEMVASKEIVTVKSARTSKSEKEDFRQRVKALLHKWESHQIHLSASDLVFVRCTYDDKLYFFEGKEEKSDSRFRHIPFETGKPTLREVERVYDRLTRCVLHDTIENTIRELRNERKQSSVSKVSGHQNVENKRRMEKKMWPWMDSGLAKRLVEYVENDDGNGLYDEVQAHSKKSQLIEYLNFSLEKFNDGTFLHFAVQKESISAVVVLLELGCDVTASDAKNKVPFEYCRTKGMQEVFVEFRSMNSELFNWNKAKVPEKVTLPVHNERKKEIVAPSKNEVSRKKRSEKLKSKKVKNYEY